MHTNPLVSLVLPVALCCSDVLADLPRPSREKHVDYLAWINARADDTARETAAEYLRAVALLNVPNSIGLTRMTWSRDELPALRPLVVANRESLDLCLEASRRPSCFFEFAAQTDEMDSNRWGADPARLKLRRICMLLAVRARLAFADGRPHDASDDLCAMLRVARHLYTQPAIVDYLCAMGCTELAWAAVADGATTMTDAAQAAALKAALASADPGHLPSLDAALAGELALTWDRMQRCLKDSDADGLCDTWFVSFRDASRLRRPLAFDDAVTHAQQTHDRWRSIFNESFLPKAMLATDGFVRELDAEPTGIAEFGIPRIGALVSRRGEAVACRSGAYLVLAVKAYKLTHGNWPDSLDDLRRDVPDLPFLDPFSPRETLRYRPTADGFLLYSIGPDAKDDAGVPMDAGRGDLVLWK